MRTNKYSSHPVTHTRAAMLIDYNSLYEAVEYKTGKTAYPDEVILEMIAELRKHLHRDFSCEVSLCRAYADFSQLGDHAGHVQRELAHNGIEPRFIPTTIQPNAPESMLSFEAGSLLRERVDESTIVILSGHRVYHALANALAQNGRDVIVLPVGMDGEVSDRDVHPLVRYVSASLLLSDAMKKVMGVETSEAEEDAFAASAGSQSRADVEHTEIATSSCRRTLEIIEHYFGQYDEVYLTPLLRKLSEEFDEHEADPKSIINELEEAGAVWLEKRRGFPYDYTVLIIDGAHPDVKRIREDSAEQGAAGNPAFPGHVDYSGPAEVVRAEIGTSTPELDTD